MKTLYTDLVFKAHDAYLFTFSDSTSSEKVNCDEMTLKPKNM